MSEVNSKDSTGTKTKELRIVFGDTTASKFCNWAAFAPQPKSITSNALPGRFQVESKLSSNALNKFKQTMYCQNLSMVFSYRSFDCLFGYLEYLGMVRFENS